MEESKKRKRNIEKQSLNKKKIIKKIEKNKVNAMEMIHDSGP